MSYIRNFRIIHTKLLVDFIFEWYNLEHQFSMYKVCNKGRFEYVLATEG